MVTVMKEKIEKLMNLVGDVLNKPIDHDKIVALLNNGLQEIGFSVSISSDELGNVVEFYDDVGYVGADNLINLILKKAGYNVFKAGRSNILVYECKKFSEKINKNINGVCILVIGDSDSRFNLYDELFISGYRFGLSTLLLNNNVVVDVHGLFGNPEEFVLDYLKIVIADYTIVSDRDSEEVQKLKMELSMKFDEFVRLFNVLSNNK